MNEMLGPYLLGPNEGNQGIYAGDARELAKAIPDESVDLIFTDPVYQNIGDYRWLAETAVRVLKSGGSVIAQCGNPNLLEVLSVMVKDDLVYQSTISECRHFALNRHFGMRVRQGWKPWAWFAKGKRRLTQFISDRYHTSGNDFKYHKWGDDPAMAAYYLGRLTGLSEVVFDPFTGGGTVPAVCKMLERRWLAFEIDPDVVGRARQRVAQTQPPLFVMQPEQMELAL